MSPTLQSLLKRTSRSFYLSIRWLPGPMRPAIGLGYLLARISDTLADTATVPLSFRLSTLEKFRNWILTGERPEDSFFNEMRSNFLPSQSHEGERELLAEQSLTEALDALSNLPGAQSEAIREVLQEIIAGQRWDLEYFAETEFVTEPDMLEHYTYQVAGCVGEFWTRIGEITLGHRFTDATEIGELMRLGRNYGQGLQLINILRDVGEDRANGRQYLPATVDWMTRCRSHLDDAEHYLAKIRGFRVRFATALPYLIARETLDLLANNQPSLEKVKVSRQVVRQCLIRGLVIALKHPR